jgi:hypothetical protein
VVNDSKDDGRYPDNLFEPRSITFIDDRREKESGLGPERLQLLMARLVKEAKFPNVEGKSPPSLVFWLKEILSREVRLPRERGKIPSKLNEFKDKEAIELSVESQTMPCHSQIFEVFVKFHSKPLMEFCGEIQFQSRPLADTYNDSNESISVEEISALAKEIQSSWKITICMDIISPFFFLVWLCRIWDVVFSQKGFFVHSFDSVVGCEDS